MEEQSEISGTGTADTNVTKEVSDSNSTSSLLMINTKKRRKPAEINTITRFKGVVVQPNGHWGAQIYAHDRIWLGTFKSQVEAAMAYDSAAIKLRSGDAHRNFPWTSVTVEEPKFQAQFTTEAVLGMIKDGSYPTKFADYLRKQSIKPDQLGRVSSVGPAASMGLVSKKLFQKELTPSDVGKLNRLVIPKKYALMHFPQISRAVFEKDGAGAGEVDDTELEFLDGSMRSWKFRYCYWKSSQSFVFTRGWNRFVREKGLRAKDLVIFSFGEFKDHGSSSDQVQSVLMIDAGYHEDFRTDDIDHLGPKSVGEVNDDHDNNQEVQSNNIASFTKLGRLRLFGVQII